MARQSTVSNGKRNARKHVNKGKRKKQLIYLLAAVGAICVLIAIIIGVRSWGGKKPVGKKDDITIDVGQDYLFVKQDGRIIYQAAEEFDTNKYKEEDFKNDLKTELSEFNKTEGDEVVKISEVKLIDGKMMMKLEFADAGAYSKYAKSYMNNGKKVTVFNGTIEDAKESKIKFDGSYKSEGSDDAIDFEKIESENLQVFVVSGSAIVEVPGDIVYVSENIKLSDGQAATAAETNYIFYKTEKEEN